MTRTRLTIGTGAEMALLSLLEPGGLLTVAQLTSQARLTTWTARAAVARLEKRGLIVPSYGRARWRITDRGRKALAVKGCRYTWTRMR